MLSSDVLEAQFGSTEVEVLRQNDTERIIRTRVIASDETLELSWVTFQVNGAKEFPSVHQAVLGGESMGKAFREANVDFLRKTRSVIHVNVPAVFEDYFGNRNTATIVMVDILVGSKEAPYAQILEVYSPEIVWPEPLTTTEAPAQKLEEFAAKLSI